MSEAPGWARLDGFAALAPETRARLVGLPLLHLAAGTRLFRAGDRAEGFVVVLEGRIEVRLTAASGREILLYAVEPGQSCVQTTLGLLADDPYTGEAICTGPVTAVVLPAPAFAAAMDSDPAFRRLVLRAFGQRMQDVTHLLEQVAFGRVEGRLAEALLDLAGDQALAITQEALAARIGTAREVVSRQLKSFAAAGLIRAGRGRIEVLDAPALRRIAANEA